MKTIKHAPTPWQQNKISIVEEDGETLLVTNRWESGERMILGNVSLDDNGEVGNKNEYAEFIARAVNNHENLIRRLESLIFHGEGKINSVDIRLAKDAIAQAEGK